MSDTLDPARSPAPSASGKEPAAPAPDVTAPEAPRWRRILAVTLLVLSVILVPLTVVAQWTRNTLLDTDRYVQTVSPLAKDPVVQTAVASAAATAIVSAIDVESTVRDLLPTAMKPLAGVVANAAREAVNRVALRFTTSPAFSTAWDKANRFAHTQVRKALLDEGTYIGTSNGRVTIDIQPILEAVNQRLVEANIPFFKDAPINVAAQRIELFRVPNLKAAQQGVKLLDTLRWVLPILSVALLALGLWLSPHRRRSLIGWALGAALALLVVGAAVSIARRYYLNTLTEAGFNRTVMADVYDTLVRFLRAGVRIGLVVALLTALLAYLAGPGKLATSVRSALSGAGAKIGGPEGSALGTWVAQHRTALVVTGIGLALGVFVLLEQPAPSTVLLVGVVLVIYLALVIAIAGAQRKTTTSQTT